MRQLTHPRLILLLAPLAALNLTIPAHAESHRYTLTTFDVPGSVFGTHATGLNNVGYIVGYYEDGQGAHGFLRDPLGNTSDVEVPGATGTIPEGINDYGVISGLYYANGGCYGFVRDSHGVYTSFSAPGESRPSTEGFGINNNSEIIAYSQASGGPSWVRSPDGLMYTITNIPDASFTIGRGINDVGATVGAVVGGSFSNTTPYLMDADHIRYVLLTVPGATQGASAYGINNQGVIVGMGSSLSGQIPFVRFSDGTFDSIQVSGEAFQEVNGVNDQGWIAGFVSDSGGAHAFILKPISDTTPPVTTAALSPNPGANGWNNSNVAITMKASDNPGGSGVKQVQFSLSGAQNAGWQTAAGDVASITITAEGTTLLTYFSTDTAGNVESAKSVTIRIDKTGPVATASVAPAPNSRGWNNSNVSVAFAGADSVSGTGPCAAPVSLTSEGANQKESGACTDRAGNPGAFVTATVNIDKIPPLLKGMPAPGCTLWPANGELVQVATVTAADLVSGVAPGTFHVTASSSEPPSGGDADIVITPAGNAFTVQLRAERSGENHGDDHSDRAAKGSRGDGGHGDSDGRVYTLTATAADLAGNVATATARCTVPHDQGK